MPYIPPVIRDSNHAAAENVYDRLKSLEKVKWGSYVLVALYKMCRVSDKMHIDQSVYSILERYKIKIMKKEEGWFLEDREIIVKFLFKDRGGFIKVVREITLRRHQGRLAGF